MIIIHFLSLTLFPPLPLCPVYPDSSHVFSVNVLIYVSINPIVCCLCFEYIILCFWVWDITKPHVPCSLCLTFCLQSDLDLPFDFASFWFCSLPSLLYSAVCHHYTTACLSRFSDPVKPLMPYFATFWSQPVFCLFFLYLFVQVI